MGMFDTVVAECPNCKTRIEFQSKSGPCLLRRYRAIAVPVTVAAGCIGDVEKCECGKDVRLVGNLNVRVTLTAVVDRDENEEQTEEEFD